MFFSCRNVLFVSVTCAIDCTALTPTSFSSFPNKRSTAHKEIATSFKDSSDVALEESNFARY